MKVALLKPPTHLKTYYEKDAELEVPYGPAEWMIQHGTHKPIEQEYAE